MMQFASHRRLLTPFFGRAGHCDLPGAGRDPCSLWVPAFAGKANDGRAKAAAGDMRKYIGWLWVVGFFSLVSTTNAQTASSPNTRYDGTYAFVSSTKVNETYMKTKTSRIGRCGNGGKVGPLSIVNGQARYSSGKDYRNLYEGTVGPQGLLMMRFVSTPAIGGEAPGIERRVDGRIDGGGTVSARQIGNRCSHDLIWQKISK
jgi:hypothetical protein